MTTSLSPPKASSRAFVPVVQIKHFEGTTSEGGSMAFYAYYDANNDMPYRVHGYYEALDGPGDFDVEDWSDAPHVVSDGEFRCVYRETP